MAEKDTAKQGGKTTRTKRKFRAAPTLREQSARNAASKTKKPSRTKRVVKSKAMRPVWAPFRFVGRGLKKVYGLRILKPLRFIIRMLGYVVAPPYVRNSFKELRFVTWPTIGTTIRLTGAVLLFAVVVSLLIAGLDVVLEKLFREVLLG